MGLLAPCLSRLRDELVPLILIAVQPVGGHGQINLSSALRNPMAGIARAEVGDAHLSGSGLGVVHDVPWW
jgi:hypothetical protein